jgi:hypothetical protein
MLDSVGGSLRARVRIVWHEAGLRRCVAATVQSGSDDSNWDSMRGSWQAGEEEQRIDLLGSAL